MKKMILLVGPPGAGKSTLAEEYVKQGFMHISQDLQGREHLYYFDTAVLDGHDVIVDRMNYSKGIRSRYLDIAKKFGYTTEIIVLHESYATCVERLSKRTGHPAINGEEDGKKAVTFFFKKYERVQDGEANIITRRFPDGDKPTAVICDLDGTLCDVLHRRHHVSGEDKNWKKFFDEMVSDAPNQWCIEMLQKFSQDHEIVFCTGRGKEYEKQTFDWLEKYIPYDIAYMVFMREAGDSRADSIVKEILLDFEILTRYTPYFVIDDRDQVVKMWRSRGLVCLQCYEGNF